MPMNKFDVDDMIMGYQRSIKYSGFFAGKVVKVRPSLKLFSDTSYEIELTEELQKPDLVKIWVDQEFSLPFNREMYEEALYHWRKFDEYLERSKKEIELIKTLFQEEK